MSYLVLARKWRPRTFDELVGQDHVRRALTNALDSGRIHHAFLFTGTRGVGKTTIARIFAKSLNCETGVSSTPCGQCPACVDIDAGRFVDLLEVDAASRTKVDDTRELLDNVQYSPARGRYKVYLIDEVHMLSTHSFNALLKTLEEPPPHVKFLLATTDPQKLPVTVLSRCLQFHLRRLPLPLIYDRLAQISTAEKVEFEPAALRAIARGAEGSMRDALSLLDQVLAFGGGRAIEAEVRTLLGTLDRKHVQGILTALAGEGWRSADAAGRAPRRTRAGLSPGARRTVGRHPAHGAAAGAAGPASRRRRGRGQAARRARREVHARKTCSCCTRSRSTRAATSTTRRMRARVSRWRCCACWRSVRRASAAGGDGGRWRGRPWRERRRLRRPRKCAETCRAAAASPRGGRVRLGRHSSPRSACRARPGISRPTACCSSARPASSGCGSIRPATRSAGRRSRAAGRGAVAALRRADSPRDHAGRGARTTSSRPPGAMRIAAEDRQRAAEQSIDSDPAVRAMREVFGATVRARFGEAAQLIARHSSLITITSARRT